MKFDIARGVFVDKNNLAESPAINDGQHSLNWREFSCEVEQWVATARRTGVYQDVPVVIYGHKEANFFVAMTGCLVIGAPFVPVDTIYPADRFERIKTLSGAAFCYMAHDDQFIATGNVPQSSGREEKLAYIIFTSGSTGEPKGVQIGRESVVSMVTWMEHCFQLGNAPIFMDQAPFSFDLSMYEVMATLALGGCCILNDRNLIAEPDRFLPRQRDAGVTCWVSTPSFAYQHLLDKKFSAEFLPTLDTFLFCGEPLTHAVAKRLRGRFPYSRIINTYGPTEATVATTWMFIDDEILSMHNPLPVGYSKPGGYVFIDPENGELCIAGDHVMRGYLNSPKLNGAKLFTHKGFPAFRTGDLGEVDENGLIFCRGRIDDQIKFNGFRIELSDIDNALLRIDGVSSAAVIALRRPDGSVGRLIGFIVVDADNDTVDEDFFNVCKAKLGTLLPKYMIPSELISTKSLPLSINHKVDRKELAAIAVGRR